LPPAEPAPAAVKRPPPEKITLDTDTYFDFDKASLKPEGQRKLDEIASRLKQMELEVVVATGHTDSIGTEKYNENLSRRRAAAVKSFLESRGLPADRIHTDGKGEKQPVASNATRDGRAKNRRVEVEVVGKKTRD
jgi:OOP family OmpA-OmpF porin